MKALGILVEHKDIDPAAIVDPIHVHAKVVCSVPVDGTFVVFVENSCKIFGMLPSNILDSKVADTESELDRPPVMFPKAWCDLALLVTVLVESFFKEILCKDAHLWKTVHALLYFDIDGPIVIGQVCEVVAFSKIGREVVEIHAPKFWSVYWCVEVEILQINSAVAWVLC